MIKIDWSLVIKKLSIVVGIIVAILLTQYYIGNQVNIRTQMMQENNARIIANNKLICENEKIQIEKDLKTKIIELESEIEKAKILIEKIKKEGMYKQMIKNDVNKFMVEVDDLLGLKGKPKDDKSK